MHVEKAAELLDPRTPTHLAAFLTWIFDTHLKRNPCVHEEVVSFCKALNLVSPLNKHIFCIIQIKAVVTTVKTHLSACVHDFTKNYDHFQGGLKEIVTFVFLSCVMQHSRQLLTF